MTGLQIKDVVACFLLMLEDEGKAYFTAQI